MQQPKQIAVILSGCGNQDGAEIHESVLTLLAIDQQGASYQVFAPDIMQTKVIDHYRKQPMSEQRNVLTESARIARGDIQPLSQFDAKNFDALIIPGGLGAALNLSNFAEKGARSSILPEVERAVAQTHQSSKPIGAICIAPTILARLLPEAVITLGSSSEAVKKAEQMGASHQVTHEGEIVVDEKNKLVTTPAYMLDSSISKVAEGINKLVQAVLKMT